MTLTGFPHNLYGAMRLQISHVVEVHALFCASASQTKQLTKMESELYRKALGEVEKHSGSRGQGIKTNKRVLRKGLPLVPIFVRLLQNGTEIREELLWACGDPDLTPMLAGNKMCGELNLPQSLETLISDQITTQVSQQQIDLAGEKLVKLEVFVRIGDSVFRDEVEWDVSNPYNLPHQYASLMCHELGLGTEWYLAIDKEVARMLEEVRQDIKRSRTVDEILPPVKRVCRDVPQRKGPRIERYNPQDDVAQKKEEHRKNMIAHKAHGTSSVKKEESSACVSNGGELDSMKTSVPETGATRMPSVQVEAVECGMPTSIAAAPTIRSLTTQPSAAITILKREEPTAVVSTNATESVQGSNKPAPLGIPATSGLAGTQVRSQDAMMRAPNSVSGFVKGMHDSAG